MDFLSFTLKGVAGNVGIDALQQTAADLEHSLADDQTAVSTLLEQLDGLLQPVIATLGGLEKRPATPVIDAPFDRDMLQPQLDTLREQLQDFDAEAADTLNTLNGGNTPTEYAEAVEALGSAIAAFNFERALEALDTLEQRLNRTTPPMSG